MVNSKYMLTFGLTEDQIQTLNDVLTEPKFEIISADSIKDIINADYFAVIISRKAVPPEDVEMLKIFLEEIDGASTTKLFISRDIDPLTTTANAEVYNTLEQLLPKLNVILRKAYDRAKRQESLTKSISVSFFITRQVAEYPGISTVDLAKQLGRSEAAVKRYIEELIMSGEKIVFDMETKGWRCGGEEEDME